MLLSLGEEQGTDLYATYNDLAALFRYHSLYHVTCQKQYILSELEVLCVLDKLSLRLNKCLTESLGIWSIMYNLGSVL